MIIRKALRTATKAVDTRQGEAIRGRDHDQNRERDLREKLVVERDQGHVRAAEEVDIRRALAPSRTQDQDPDRRINTENSPNRPVADRIDRVHVRPVAPKSTPRPARLRPPNAAILDLVRAALVAARLTKVDLVHQIATRPHRHPLKNHRKIRPIRRRKSPPKSDRQCLTSQRPIPKSPNRMKRRKKRKNIPKTTKRTSTNQQQ